MTTNTAILSGNGRGRAADAETTMAGRSAGSVKG